MKSKSVLAVALLATFLCSCGSDPAANNTAAAKPTPASPVSPTPVPTASIPKNGDYNAKGVVTKINLDLASVELNHEEIKDLMPAMLMEFFVSDKKFLNGLKVGDKVDFVVRYKDGAETIVDIKKAP
jgi:Cu/Ag efflux protein CusF